MTKTRFRVGDIQSFTPAVDTRGIDEVYLLGGKNYVFDSKGPKSGFGTRLIAGTESIEIERDGGYAQSVEVGEYRFVFTSQGAWRLIVDPDNPLIRNWTRLNIVGRSEFEDWTSLGGDHLYRWTGAYLADGIYFCHRRFGFYMLRDNELIHRDGDDWPGMTEYPIGIAEANGRLLILDQNYIKWSAPANGQNFVPALGGAGQQLLSERVSGTPLCITPFMQGFAVWTTTSCLLVEHIGGDSVYRFDRLPVEQIPLNAHCVDMLPDSSWIIATQQGIYVFTGGQEPKAATPVFNEFYRGLLEKRPDLDVRIDYDLNTDRLFVQLRDDTCHVLQTYVLGVSLDKWGEFSEDHYGIISYEFGRGKDGYVDNYGVAHRFVDTINRETEPHVFQGLDSNVEFGYIKPPELHGEIDSLMELQEIFLGSRPARPSTDPLTIVDLGEVEPNFTLVCTAIDIEIDFTTLQLTVDGWDMTTYEVFDGLGADLEVPYTADGFVISADSEERPIFAFSGLWYDMTDWTLVERCKFPGSSDFDRYLPSWTPEQAAFWYDPGSASDSCLTGQATFSTNIVGCRTGMHRFERYLQFTSPEVSRAQSLTRWSSNGGECLMMPEGQEYDFDLACGVTCIFELKYIGAEVAPAGIVLSIGNATGTIQVHISDWDRIEVTGPDDIDFEAFPVGGLVETIKFGVTLARVTDDYEREYAISIEGAEAVVESTAVFYPFGSDASDVVFALGHDPDSEEVLGELIAIKTLKVMSPVDPETLATLTASA